MKINHNIINLILSKLNDIDKINIIKSNNIFGNLWVCNGFYSLHFSIDYDQGWDMSRHLITKELKKIFWSFIDNYNPNQLDLNDEDLDFEDFEKDDFIDEFDKDKIEKFCSKIKFYSFGKTKKDVLWNLFLNNENFILIFLYFYSENFDIFDDYNNSQIKDILCDSIDCINIYRDAFFLKENNLVPLGLEKILNKVYHDYGIKYNNFISLKSFYMELFDNSENSMEKLKKIRKLIIEKNEKKNIILILKYFTELTKIF